MKSIKVMVCALFVFTIGFCFATIASAKSKVDSLYYDDSVSFVKYDTESIFTTAIKASYLEKGPVSVYNSIQRVNIIGYKEVASYTFKVSETNKGYGRTFTLSGTKDTKTIWTNKTKNSCISAKFYINNGES